MTYNVRNILIALVLAGIAAGAVVLYTGSVQEQAKSSQETVKVLVATSDVPAGTPAADAISSGQLRLQDVVAVDQMVGALTDPKQLDGTLVAAQNLFAGQQITAAMFSPSNQTSTGTRIKSNYRAIQIAINENAILSGTLRAGDHIDLVGTYNVQTADSGKDVLISRIIVRDVEVLKAPEAVEGGTKLGQSSGGSSESVILAVPDTVAPKVTFTINSGDMALWFVLRPGEGDTDGATTLATVNSVVFEGVPYAQIRKALSPGS